MALGPVSLHPGPISIAEHSPFCTVEHVGPAGLQHSCPSALHQQGCLLEGCSTLMPFAWTPSLIKSITAQ